MRPIRRISEALNSRPHLVLWLIAAYYILAVILRLLRSEALQSDEAEQIYQSQFLLLGYGRQPPFYNWLQYGVIQLVGPSVLALSIVKNLLLFLCCVFYLMAARLVLKDGRLVAVAALGAVAMPTVSVLAQRDLTHAVATLFAVSLFLYGFLKTLTRPSLGSYLLTGLAVGIGLISKYNFVIVPLAAVLAILPEASLRKRIFDWRILPALAVAAAICLPHGLWLLGNLGTATEGTIEALREDASGNPLADRLTGLVMLAVTVVDSALPTLAFFLVAFRRPLVTAWRAENLWSRVVGRWILFSLLAIAAIGLGLGATTVSQKWLSPFLLLLPLYLCLKLEAAGADTKSSVSRMLPPVSALAIGFIIYLPVANIVGPQFGRFGKENLPARPFVELVLDQRAGTRPSYVMASDPFLAASARLELREARVLLPGKGEAALNEAKRSGGDGLVIWRVRGDDRHVPDWLEGWLNTKGIPGSTVETATIDVPYLFASPSETVTFGYAWISPGTGP